MSNKTTQPHQNRRPTKHQKNSLFKTNIVILLCNKTTQPRQNRCPAKHQQNRLFMTNIVILMCNKTTQPHQNRRPTKHKKNRLFKTNIVILLCNKTTQPCSLVKIVILLSIKEQGVYINTVGIQILQIPDAQNLASSNTGLFNGSNNLSDIQKSELFRA